MIKNRISLVIEMKYYIATSLSNKKSHNQVRDALTLFEHEISCDWSTHEVTKPASKERLKEIAIRDLAGVLEADFLIVLLPAGKGTHLELGFAVANEKKIFVHSEDSKLLEPGLQTSVFYYHPNINRITCPLKDLASIVNSSLQQAITK